MDKHWRGTAKHDTRQHRDGFPSIDADGLTLREIRKRVRGEGMEPGDEANDAGRGESEVK